jgi:hypothetical protein
VERGVAVADPVKLAAWMIRFRFADQDWFDIDPVRYRTALGEAGMVAYRDAIDQIDDAGSFGVVYVRERLAVLDQDIERIVQLHGRDLSNTLQIADRRAYSDGVRILKKASRAADAAEISGLFGREVGRLREQYRRRPTLIAMLDKAGFE